MKCLGQIQAVPGSAAIDSSKWLALIDSHGALEHVPARKGINPFTREPVDYKAPATSALIRVQGAQIGSIFWAMDGSPYLMVQAEEGSVETVAALAREIAAALGAQFVREIIDE
jgi:hypothetical protein